MGFVDTTEEQAVNVMTGLSYNGYVNESDALQKKGLYALLESRSATT
jgi:hypothetical protein